MFDPVTLLTGAGLLATGYGAGRIGRSRRHPKPRKPTPPPKPICGCGHNRSFHAKGRCTGEVGKYPYNYQCKCGEYVGPEPMPEYYAPEIGG